MELPDSDIAVLDYILKGCTHPQLDQALTELVAQCQAMPSDKCCTLARRLVLVGANPAACIPPANKCAIDMALDARDMPLVALLVMEAAPEMIHEALRRVGALLVKVHDLPCSVVLTTHHHLALTLTLLLSLSHCCFSTAHPHPRCSRSPTVHSRSLILTLALPLLTSCYHCSPSSHPPPTL